MAVFGFLGKIEKGRTKGDKDRTNYKYLNIIKLIFIFIIKLFYNVFAFIFLYNFDFEFIIKHLYNNLAKQ